MCDENAVLMAASKAVDGSAQQQVRFTWLNAADGRVITSSAVEGLSDVDPRLGAIVSVRGRMFALFGKGQQDVTREVVELVGADSDKAPRASSGGG
jgi:hypothetical protein